MFSKIFKKNNSESGFAVLEAIISMVIGVVILLGYISLNINSAQVSRANTSEIQATLYLRELIEVSKDLERSNWAELDPTACGAQCYPIINSGSWQLTGGEETIDANFTRSLAVSPVERDAAGQIVPTGSGTPDPRTKKVTATITWDNNNGPRTKTLETFVYDL